jgi:TRAP-type C4-dicarboxylate transport system substrate-binding protein
VLLEWSDTLTSLQTGMVDAVPTIPIQALSSQFYLSTHHMLKLNWLPLVGALLVTKKSWDALQPSEREAMLKAAQDCSQEFQALGPQQSEESVEAMEKRGLQVHDVSKESEEEWRRFSESLYPKIRGKIVPADVFDEVMQVLREYRATQGTSGK